MPARALAWVLALSLLVAQWLALVHAAAHAPVATGSVVAQAMANATNDSSSLAQGHTSQAACQLFDHLLMGQAPVTLPASLTGLPSPSRVVLAPDAALPRPTALAHYEARGPPRA
jgi:hypothetical protein